MIQLSLPRLRGHWTLCADEELATIVSLVVQAFDGRMSRLILNALMVDD